MAPAIPDRWKDYKPVGKKIDGTRFIAFKVPLKEHISNIVDKDIRLDGKILLESVPNLGLIIDLTNTNRYYDPKFFEKEGVVHKKLMTPGHETPPKHIVDKFNTIVKEFIENNTDNDKLIGVHCTHGVNRTGYLICNYMISQMTMEPNDAMDRFSNARGHKIERDNYIDALNKPLQKAEVTKIESGNWRDREERNKFNSPGQRDRYQRQESRRYYNRYEDSRRRSRSRSNSPPPYYADNNRRNDYYSYRRPEAAEYNTNNNNYRNNYYNNCNSAAKPRSPPPPHLAQREDEQLMNGPNSNYYQPPYQPPRLRLDYYNQRSNDNVRKRHNHSQRFMPNNNRRYL